MKEKKMTLRQILLGEYELHGKAAILGIILWCVTWAVPLWGLYVLVNTSSVALFGIPVAIWAIVFAFACGVMFAKGMSIHITRTKRTQNKLKDQEDKKK